MSSQFKLKWLKVLLTITVGLHTAISIKDDYSGYVSKNALVYMVERNAYLSQPKHDLREHGQSS